MRYVTWKRRSPNGKYFSRYTITKSFPKGVDFTDVVEMPHRPKAGQFWVNKNRPELVCFITSTNKCHEKYDRKWCHRDVCIYQMRWNHPFRGGYGVSLFHFLHQQTLITDKDEIWKQLEILISRCQTHTQAKRILRLKELGLSEEDRNLLMLRALED